MGQEKREGETLTEHFQWENLTNLPGSNPFGMDPAMS